MEKLLLIPQEKPLDFEKVEAVENGLLLFVGKGKFWTNFSEFSYAIVQYTDTRDPSVIYYEILDVKLVLTVNSLFMILKNKPGVFACPYDEKTFCYSLFPGKILSSGITVADALNGKSVATCISAHHNLIAYGDSWGHVCIWDLTKPIDCPPLWTFGAHGKFGCSSLRFLPTGNDLITVGGKSDEIKIWKMNDGNTIIRESELLLSSPYVVSTNIGIMYTKEHQLIVLAGTIERELLCWNVTLSRYFYLKISLYEDICLVEGINDTNLIVTLSNDEVIVLNIEEMKMDHRTRLNSRVIGVDNGNIVLLNTQHFSLDELKMNTQSSAEELLESQVDIDNAMHYLLQTKATAKYATMRALNVPPEKYDTYGKALIPLSPQPNCIRSCCTNTPAKEEQLWVKRKVKAPEVTKQHRKPLYPHGKKKSEHIKVDLPPFITQNRRFLPIWMEPNFFLKEKNGEVFFVQ